MAMIYTQSPVRGRIAGQTLLSGHQQTTANHQGRTVSSSLGPPPLIPISSLNIQSPIAPVHTNAPVQNRSAAALQRSAPALIFVPGGDWVAFSGTQIAQYNDPAFCEGLFPDTQSLTDEDLADLWNSLNQLINTLCQSMPKGSDLEQRVAIFRRKLEGCIYKYGKHTRAQRLGYIQEALNFQKTLRVDLWRETRQKMAVYKQLAPVCSNVSRSPCDSEVPDVDVAYRRQLAADRMRVFSALRQRMAGLFRTIGVNMSRAHEVYVEVEPGVAIKGSNYQKQNLKGFTPPPSSAMISLRSIGEYFRLEKQSQALQAAARQAQSQQGAPLLFDRLSGAAATNPAATTTATSVGPANNRPRISARARAQPYSLARRPAVVARPVPQAGQKVQVDSGPLQ